MKLYQSPKAPNPDRVVFFLRAKGRLDAVEMIDVSIMEQEHKTAEYRALSPYAQVPTLVLDDGTAITESRAICTYFEGVFPEPNLMGRDPPRARRPRGRWPSALMPTLRHMSSSPLTGSRLPISRFISVADFAGSCSGNRTRSTSILAAGMMQ